MALVLIIDDEPEICRFVVRALTSAGHQAISATDGTAGLSWQPNVGLISSCWI